MLRPSAGHFASIKWIVLHRLTATVLALGLLATPAAFAQANTARSGGPGVSAMVSKSNLSPAPGIVLVRPVLSGVLYRAGFKGGDPSRTGLSQSQRDDLCGAGFSAARYIDFGTKTAFGATKCKTGAMSYAPGRSSKSADMMQDISDIINHPDRGSVRSCQPSFWHPPR